MDICTTDNGLIVIKHITTVTAVYEENKIIVNLTSSQPLTCTYKTKELLEIAYKNFEEAIIKCHD